MFLTRLFRKGKAATESDDGHDGSNAAAIDGSVTNPKEIPPLTWPTEPETSASLLSRVVFLWIQPMFSRASLLRKHGQWLEQADLAPLASSDRTAEVEALFEKAYAEYVPKKKKRKDPGAPLSSSETSEELEARLAHALIATSKRELMVAGVVRFLNTVLQFTFPILLNLILSYYQDVQSGVITSQDPPAIYYKGYWLSALLMVFVGSKAVTESSYFHLMNRCSWR
jgi:hypothetical protein